MVSSETGGGGLVGLTTAELVVEGGWDDTAMYRVGDSAALMSVLTRRSVEGKLRWRFRCLVWNLRGRIAQLGGVCQSVPCGSRGGVYHIP